MKGSSMFWLPLALVALLGAASTISVRAQVESGHSSSSSTTTEATIKGYAFKYKQRFDNYAQQIDMGISKGWLKADQAETFKTRLSELRSVESAASHNGYAAADIANLDKMTTKFNEDLSSASSKTTPATTAEPANSGASSSASSAAKSGVTKKETTTKKTAAPKKTSTSTTVKHTVSQ